MPGVPNYMRGAQQVRKVLIPFLAAEMPPMIDLCRINWDLTPEYLPYPAKYDANDPFIGEGLYPLVGMYITGNNNQRATVDYDDAMAQEYQFEYSARLFVTVASPTDEIGNVLETPQGPFGNAIQVRDDMLTVLRMCLLAKNSLGAGGQAYLVEESMQEDFPDPMASKSLGGKYLAAGIVTATIRMTERLQLQPYGHANTLTTQIINVGPAEPFEE